LANAKAGLDYAEKYGNTLASISVLEKTLTELKNEPQAFAAVKQRIDQLKEQQGLLEDQFSTQVSVNAEASKTKVWEQTKKRVEIAHQLESTLVSIAEIQRGMVQAERVSTQESLAMYGLDITNLSLINQQLEKEEQIQLRLRQIASDKAQALAALPLNTSKEQKEAKGAEFDNKEAAERAALEISKQRTAEQLLYNIELSRTKELTDAATAASESLASVFSELGSAMGGIVTSMVAYSTTMQANSKAEIVAQKNLEKIKADGLYTYEEVTEAENILAKAKKKSKKDELDGNIAVVSSTKKMFSEKTAAHKALAVVEKLLHLERLANTAKELASTISSVAKSITAKTPDIMAEFLRSIPPPFGWVAGAAAIAALGGSFSGGGGGFTASAAQMQETQGTGQSYDANGNLVSNGGGVLGDLTAKNEDIANSIDTLSKLTIDGNIIGNDMVIALEKIKYNTQQMAAGFFKVQGLTGGLSGFGTVEESSPGILGAFATSTSIIDTGIKFLAGKFQQYETVKETNSGLFGFLGGTSVGDKTKELPSYLIADIEDLFSDNVRLASKAISQLTNLTQTSIEEKITSSINKEGMKI
jgi:hypothetical protein